MIHLEEKIYLYALAAIPVVVMLFILMKLWQRRARKKFGKASVFKHLSPAKSRFKPFLKLVVRCLVITSLAIALANPKVGTKMETVKREGVDIVFAIDVSKSMLAEDITPNRLEKAKRLVSELLNKLAGDRVGIIAYAGQAYPQLPITTDYAAAKMFLQQMNTDMLSSQGTAIDQAIRLATSYFDDEEQTNRILFILSDGEDHAEGASIAATEAVNKGILIYTVGLGTSKGSPIPERIRGVIDTYKKDNTGEVVITKLDENLLKDIAQNGKGDYINGFDTEEVVSFVEEVLTNMEKKEFETKQFVDFKDQFQWFLGAAIALLFLDIFLLERKTAWVQRLNLFNERNKKE